MAIKHTKETRQEEKVEASKVHAVHAGRPGEDAVFSSYSGMSFSSSFDPDNVQVDRTPQFSGFLVSFMVDARGGAMRGCRHSGVRIIIPPGHTSMPTRVTCKLVKKEKLTHPPPLMEGEALASRILEMGPSNAKFLGPVVIEVPHFASLRGKEREIVILRSDNGETWREHTIEATELAIQEALHGSFEGDDDADLESAEDIYKTRITRILTTDFPQYFAVVTRIRQETCTIGTEGGMISSTVVPQVQAVFPDGSLTKKIKVGLQAQPVQPELVSKMLGNRVAVSPIVTVEPRRRKFHKPITLTIPVPKASQKGMINQYGGETPTLRLLCSITGGTSPAQWEDITGSTPLKFINDCVSFTTTVSARFWLMDCQNINEAAKMSTELYREAIAVPFMAKFVVFGKRHDHQEARLRLFCMTDDKMDKTLESQEHFEEIARSRDVEVLDSKPQYVEMAGNLVPVTKSGEQLYVNFNAFRENRLPFNVRIRDLNQDPLGRVAFMKEPKQARDQAPQTPICNLNITLPGGKGDPGVDADTDTTSTTELRQQYDMLRGAPGKEQISRAELRLTDIAEDIGSDWVPLARELRFTEEEITTIQTEYTYTSEQALVMLQQWLNKQGDKATGNELERALKNIGRDDVIQKNMRNVEDVGDAVERAVAKVHIDQAGFDAFKEELGPSRGSSIPRGVSLDVSYDEHDLAKDWEEIQRDEISEVEKRETRKQQESEFIVAEYDDRHGVVKTPTEEEREAASKAKAEAYLQLAQTMGMDDVEIPEPDRDGGDSIKEEPILEERKESIVDDLVQKVEALKVEGMDDRVSLDSDDERAPEVTEQVVTKETHTKVKSAPAYGDTQTFEDWAEQNATQYTAAEARAQPDQATFEDWVEKKRIDDKVSDDAVMPESAGVVQAAPERTIAVQSQGLSASSDSLEYFDAEDTKPTDVPTDDEEDLPAAMVAEPPEPVELVSAQAAFFTQDEYAQEPMEASKLERQRLKSSFEDLYTGADLSYESGETEDLTVGDKFDTRQYEKHLEKHADKSSSFENLYLETPKEAEDEEEKDVDEKERLAKEVEEEFQRPEKGEAENEKEITMDDEEYDEFEEEPASGTKSPDIEVLQTVRFTADAVAQPDLIMSERHVHHTHTAPIDTTYEAGLDSIGKDAASRTSEEKEETFLRSSSCDEQAELAMSDRERHHSAPESFSSKGEAAEGGDMQETKVVLKKQIHKKTIMKDGQEETVITEDTHVEQDNEGPGELRDSMQKIIDEFMVGGQPQSKSSEV